MDAEPVPNDDPVITWVRRRAEAGGARIGAWRRRTGKERRKLAAAVRAAIADAAELAHPDDPQSQEHLTTLLLETDTDTWPLVDGTNLLDLPPAAREWLRAAEGLPDDGDVEDGGAPEHPMLVPLCAAILEEVRRRFVTGDERFGELWLDFEDASGIDASRLALLPYHDDEAETLETDAEAPEEKRRLPSLAPWILGMAGFGIVLDLSRLTGGGGPGWLSGAIVLAAIGAIVGLAVGTGRR